MLNDLLSAAGVPYFENANGFILDGTYFATNPHLLNREDPFILRDITHPSIFWISCWDSFGTSLIVAGEFAFIGEETLVLTVRDNRTLCDKRRKELSGIAYRDSDRRILNRLRARELLK